MKVGGSNNVPSQLLNKVTHSTITWDRVWDRAKYLINLYLGNVMVAHTQQLGMSTSRHRQNAGGHGSLDILDFRTGME